MRTHLLARVRRPPSPGRTRAARLTGGQEKSLLELSLAGDAVGAVSLSGRTQICHLNGANLAGQRPGARPPTISRVKGSHLPLRAADAGVHGADFAETLAGAPGHWSGAAIAAGSAAARSAPFPRSDARPGARGLLPGEVRPGIPSGQYCPVDNNVENMGKGRSVLVDIAVSGCGVRDRRAGLRQVYQRRRRPPPVDGDYRDC